jgi:hypothetical protein
MMCMRVQDAEAGSSPAEWRVVWLERDNGGAGFSGNWAGFAKDQVRLWFASSSSTHTIGLPPGSTRPSPGSQRTG